MLAGDVPRLDFRGYDPGRYYWCAAWSWLFGDGLLTLRLALALYQAVGLFFALRVARRAYPEGASALPIGLVLLAIALSLWAFPRQKVFDHTAAAATAWVLARFFERRDARRALEAGAWTGLALFFGRNHALYAGVASAAAFAWLLVHERARVVRAGTSFAGGVAIGLIPVLAMFVFVPGYADVTFRLAAELAGRASNLSVPIPWPWTIDYARHTAPWIVQLLGTGTGFLLMLVSYPLGLVAVFRATPERMSQRGLGAFAGCIVAGSVWAHHAAVRSDAAHLAEAAHPLWVALFLAPAVFGGPRARAWKAGWGALFAALTLAVPPFADVRFAWIGKDPWVRMDVRGDSVTAPPGLAAYVDIVRHRVAATVPDDELILVAPFEPAFYPLLDRPAPIYDTYLLWPAPEGAQQRAIADLERQGVDFALIGTTVIDGDIDRHFTRTNPLLAAYLDAHFELVPGQQVPHRLFLRRKQNGPDGDTPPGPSEGPSMFTIPVMPSPGPPDSPGDD